MKIQCSKLLCVACAATLTTAPAFAAPWVPCGTISQFTVANNGTIPGYSPTKYEYAISYNSSEPIPIISLGWNSGIRIVNKEPYMVSSDNPASGMDRGGFMFYTGTLAPDDNCGSGKLRHQYWFIDSDNSVTTFWTNGCYGNNLAVFCRSR